MTTTFRNEDMRLMVDYEKGTVDRRIFSDQDIYDLELERIFAKAWNFMAHDSQIPNPGDFFLTFIGEDRVICVRDNDGNPQVLVNTCRHRGNAICRAEEGHATSFMCTYHGWTYDLKGNLVGVPGFKEVYHEELDRENWGLIKAAQVGSITEVSSSPTTVPQNTIGSATVSCPADTKVVGGGYDTNSNLVVNIGLETESRRTDNGWRARILAQGGDSQLTAFAFCLEA